MHGREHERRTRATSQARPAQKSVSERRTALRRPVGTDADRASEPDHSLGHHFETIGVLPTTGDAAADAGQQLDPLMRPRLETFFGSDLGDVRVHTDERADALARGYRARAFTSGTDIFFRSGAYAPDSREGRATLAHEVAHAVQQSSGGTDHLSSAPTIGEANDAFEQAAWASAALVDAGVPTIRAMSVPAGSPPTIQCEPDDDEPLMSIEPLASYDEPQMSGGIPPNINPYGPTVPVPDPLGPTQLPPGDLTNPRIPGPPRVPNIPTPPEGGFPKPPPTPASPGGGGAGFWGTLSGILTAIGGTLIDIFPPVPKKLLNPYSDQEA